MAKSMKRDEELKKYRKLIKKLYRNGKIKDLSDKCSPLMPEAEKAREVLHKVLNICRSVEEREFRVYLVEKLNDFKVFVQIPDSKKAYGLTKKEQRFYGIKGEITCDFNVWFMEKNDIKTLTLPTHDFMFGWYIKLKKKLPEKLLFGAINTLVRDRKNPLEIINTLLRGKVSKAELNEIKKFLVTLKWIVLQEDVNYKPRKYMGSKYTLAAYALLEMGFTPQEIRRLIRF